jgi:hypothetical protein
MIFWGDVLLHAQDEKKLVPPQKPASGKLGSARVSRADFGVSPKQSLQKSPRSRGRDRQHARRYPEERETNLQQLFRNGIG